MKSPAQKGPRVNQQIRVPEVRVIENGKMLGVLKTTQAIELAKNQGVDLIEIDPNGKPPTCKLMEYGKFKYDLKKREHEQRANQKKVDLKELRIRPNTEDHDLNVKVKHAREFLAEGDKVKFVMQFSGREQSYKSAGETTLKEIFAKLEDLGKLDAPIKSEGRYLMMVVSPGPVKK